MHWTSTGDSRLRSLGMLAAVIAGLAGCHSAPPSPSGLAVDLRSPSFVDGNIPARCSSCSGRSNTPPALSWGAAPVSTKSLALLVYDRDSPFSANFVHWVMYDIPPMTTSLAEGTPKQGELPDGARHKSGSATGKFRVSGSRGTERTCSSRRATDSGLPPLKEGGASKG